MFQMAARQSLVDLCTHVSGAYLRGRLHETAFRLLHDDTGVSVYRCNSCVEHHKVNVSGPLELGDILQIGDELVAICGKCFARGYPPIA